MLLMWDVSGACGIGGMCPATRVHLVKKKIFKRRIRVGLHTPPLPHPQYTYNMDNTYNTQATNHMHYNTVNALLGQINRAEREVKETLERVETYPELGSLLINVQNASRELRIARDKLRHMEYTR